ncbi:ASCH domain-containing protein [Shimia aestuarii]|uniref:ASCH domain-containing protein n=1 Tax=Shimia aestuarii TaxID=254406 RepID=UPI001FB403DA|nr:ASCH domain-containing protein [Shimia aestuarii]
MTGPIPAKTLLVVDRLFPEILSGAKTSTIRWREARIVPGPLRFAMEGDPSKTVDVTATRCTDMPLSKAAAFVGRAKDWPDPVMLEGMREHYPEITLSDEVQVIEFALRPHG